MALVQLQPHHPLALSLARPKSLLLALVLPLTTLSIVYLVHVNRNIQRQTRTLVGRRQSTISAPQQPRDPASLPADADQADVVVVYERVESVPVPASNLVFALPDPSPTSRVGPSQLLHAYTCAVHRAFSSTPQAWLLRALADSWQTRRTFEHCYIDQLTLRRGEMVNGVYAVSCHQSPDALGSERVEMMIRVPGVFWSSASAHYSASGGGTNSANSRGATGDNTGSSSSASDGVVGGGLIVAAIEPVSPRGWDTEKAVVDVDDDVIFVNETWMWRGVDEKPTLLETGLGGWLHSRLAGWLVVRGMEAVVAKKPTSA